MEHKSKLMALSALASAGALATVMLAGPPAAGEHVDHASKEK